LVLPRASRFNPTPCIARPEPHTARILAAAARVPVQGAAAAWATAIPRRHHDSVNIEARWIALVSIGAK
jgi:hypothetical protein